MNKHFSNQLPIQLGYKQVFGSSICKEVVGPLSKPSMDQPDQGFHKAAKGLENFSNNSSDIESVRKYF